jgi:3-hydroxybutyryl-CoA dehydrogenase
VRVLVLGAGLMGSQIGCEYAVAAHDVTLVSRDTGAVAERLRVALTLLEGQRLASAGTCDVARKLMRIAGSLDEAGGDFDLVVESLPEDLALKIRLLGEASAGSPTAVLASNTSSIPITTLGAEIGEEERVIGTHYLNPPLLMPPVEVIAGEGTEPGVVRRIVELLSGLGKLPVVVRRDVPGFLWNRLQVALVRECAWLVDNGVAGIDEVDLVVREGLARRWRRVGPFAAIGLGGLDTWNRTAANLGPELSTASDLGDLSRFTTAVREELDRLVIARDGALAEELRQSRERLGRE